MNKNFSKYMILLGSGWGVLLILMFIALEISPVLAGIDEYYSVEAMKLRDQIFYIADSVFAVWGSIAFFVIISPTRNVGLRADHKTNIIISVCTGAVWAVPMIALLVFAFACGMLYVILNIFKGNFSASIFRLLCELILKSVAFLIASVGVPFALTMIATYSDTLVCIVKAKLKEKIILKWIVCGLIYVFISLFVFAVSYLSIKIIFPKVESFAARFIQS